MIGQQKHIYIYTLNGLLGTTPFPSFDCRRVQVTRFIDYAPMVFQLGPYLE